METIVQYWPWLFLLLPVVYLFGWLKGRSNSADNQSESSHTLSSDYFKGLNYLLSDQQDRALPVFLKLVQIDNETIETHLALATIYRRSGNYDKAIEIHQNLIAKPSLSAKYRSKALLELGRDYLTAGLFDRAEGLFNDVIRSGFYDKAARQYKLTIYQQEKEWLEAITEAKTLIQQGDTNLKPLIAQLYCELSEQFFAKGNIKQAELAIKDALTYNAGCVRALIARVRNAVRIKKYKDAIRYIKQIQQTDSDYFLSVLSYCVEAYRELGKVDELIDYLKLVEKENININLTEVIAGLITEHQSADEAQSYLRKQLSLAPSMNGLASFINLMNKQGDYTCNTHFQEIQKVIESMKKQNEQYHCNKCGYTSGTLNWQCPSCHAWGEIKPVAGNINAQY
ncbi:MAG: lipopolysaccharide assembly protein LapB [Gammaproteobacteria bacterium]|nr:lipopolysaccharide assembly protein LapB [Gammaproteobacteria bacterium]